MRDQQEFRGHWWLPGTDEPAAAVGGILQYDPTDGLGLHLFDTISEDRPGVDCIYGTTTAGNLITLNECTRTYQRFGSNDGYQDQRYTVNEGYVGAHISPNTSVSKTVHAEYSILQEWMNLTGMGFSSRQIDNNTEERFSLSFTEPDSISVETNQATITFRTQSSMTVSATGGGSIEENGVVTIDMPSPRSTADLLDSVNIIREFLVLGTGEPVNCTGVEFVLETETAGTDPKTVELLRATPEPASSPTPVHPEMMLFTLRDIEPVLDGLLDRWWRITSTYSRSIQLFVKSEYYTNDIDLRYSGLVNCLETAYETIYRSDPTGEPPTALHSRINTLLETATDHGDGSSQDLIESIDLSLQTKLQHLVEHSETLSELDYNFDKYLATLSRSVSGDGQSAYTLLPDETCNLFHAIFVGILLDELDISIEAQQQSYLESHLP